MRHLTWIALVVALAGGLLPGCSEKTQQEASEAVQESGEAIESAAEDAANVTEGALEGASDAVEQNTNE